MKTLAITSLLAAAIVALMAGPASADVSQTLQKKLKGKMYIATEPFALEGEDDAEVLKNLEKQARAVVSHADEADGVATWRLSFVAFLSKKPGVTELSVDFYTDDGKKTYVANKRLSGISPDLPLLASDFEITEDEGLTRGKPYVVNLTATVRGKPVVLATTRLRPQ